MEDVEKRRWVFVCYVVFTMHRNGYIMRVNISGKYWHSSGLSCSALVWNRAVFWGGFVAGKERKICEGLCFRFSG